MSKLPETPLSGNYDATSDCRGRIASELATTQEQGWPATVRCSMLPSLMNCPVYLIRPETLVDGLHSLVPIGAHLQTAHFELISAEKGLSCGNGGSRGCR
jgi:hypothetical protein